MKRIALLLAGILQFTGLWAQTSPGLATLPAGTPSAKVTNLLQAFQQGHFSGSFRSFFMATDNAAGLSDYHALAAGGGLHFNSAPWHGFSFGIGGMFIYNLTSSDLGAKDARTGAANRYEIGLFDVTNPQNRTNLDRIDQLWLRYQWKKSRITIGQQSVQTPFINYQDGRMRPNAETGLWAEMNALKNTKIEGGWLWKISPRGTVASYNIGESIGIYPKGLNTDGTGSGYPENLKSDGIAVLGITRQVGTNTKIQVWNHYIANILNTAFIQADYTCPLKNSHQLLFGMQMMHENAVAWGGNKDVSRTYIQKGQQSNAFSVQAGWQRGGWQALAAYTRVTADGRFLSPREWGREPFYTYMPRERVEGSGDLHAVTVRTNWQTNQKKLRFEVAYGHFYLPDVKNHLLNKYAFPAFNQFNFDVRYAFGGALEGLRAQFLYVRKGRLGEVYGDDKFVINKVDMSLYNLIFNYTY